MLRLAYETIYGINRAKSGISVSPSYLNYALDNER
jgi:hypothetical protein